MDQVTTNKNKILVVDDLKMNCDLICEILEMENEEYEVKKAYSGDEAMAYLEHDWDIVISDKNMPGSVDGIDLLHKVKEKTSADVILMTGFPNLETAIESVRGKAFDYLIKPISINSFRLSIRRCLEMRRLNKELAREKTIRNELESAYAELKKMSKIKKVFGQFAANEVAEFATENPDFWKKSEIKQATVMFADVVNFTKFTQKEDPIEVVKAINGIHSCIFTAIVENGGVLNKFLGDGLLAIFGAPLPQENHAEKAVSAAIKAQQNVKALNTQRCKQGLVSLPIRIGINTGDVVAGCVGTNERTEYTVMGHAVNCASRFEESAQSGEILIGENTYKHIAKIYSVVKELPLQLQGVQGEVTVYKVLREAEKIA